MPRPCLLIANWKMTKVRSDAQAFCNELASLLPKQNLPQLAICPSFTLLETVSTAIKQLSLPVSLGAQNMAEAQEGAYTGETSYPQLLDLGVTLVLLGHSERRELFGESNIAVNAKAKQALAQGLTPVICVGESLAQRQAGEALRPNPPPPRSCRSFV